MTYQLTELERSCLEPIACAQDLAGTWPVVKHPHPRGAQERAEVMNNLGFGTEFSDFMAHATWTEEKGWADLRIEPYSEISLDPTASVLHYGQETFEGLKAYRHKDGSVWTFRPAYNAARLNYSNRRLAIPELDRELFMGSIVNLVRADEAWVPDAPGSSLYLRPFVFASEPFLGVRAARRYEYIVVASPSGAYFQHGFQPIKVWVEREYHRAGPGGMGDAKTGGNYAASLFPKVIAHEKGYDEVMFLDSATSANIDELGGMNVFVVMRDGTIRTPALTGNILAGCTRSSILQLLREQGKAVREETISISEVIEGAHSGRVKEIFACGTAAVITSIGSLTGDDFHVEFPEYDVTKSIHDAVTGIQMGEKPDIHNWLYRLV